METATDGNRRASFLASPSSFLAVSFLAGRVFLLVLALVLPMLGCAGSDVFLRTEDFESRDTLKIDVATDPLPVPPGTSLPPGAPPEPLPPAPGDAPAPRIVGLELVPPQVEIASSSAFSLRANVQAVALLSNGTREDVTRDVVYSGAVGGTLAGELFLAGPVTAQGSVTFRVTRDSSSASAVLEIAVVAVQRRLVDLTLSPDRIRMAAGGVLHLPSNVQAVARFDDGSAEDVSSLVSFDRPRGGVLSGGSVFVAGPSTGTGAVRVSFSRDGVTRTAILGLDFFSALKRPVSLAVTPRIIDVAAGSTSDLRRLVSAVATFDDGSTRDVSHEVTHRDPAGGTLAGFLFVAAGTAVTGGVTLAFTSESSTVLARVTVNVVDVTPELISLAATSTVARLDAGSTADLRRLLQATATFSDGSRIDVSGGVDYVQVTGGTLEGSVLAVSPGAARIDVTASLTAGTVTRTATVQIPVRALPSAPSSLVVTPSVVSVLAGSRFGLRDHLQTSALFPDRPPEDVSALVVYQDARGGVLERDVFVAGDSPQSGAVTVRLDSAGVTLLATVSVAVVLAPADPPVSLGVTPSSLILVSGTSTDLRSLLQVEATLQSGTKVDVSRDVIYSDPQGGTLGGSVFTAGSRAGAGSVTVSLIRDGVAVSAGVPLVILPRDAAVPLSLRVEPLRTSFGAGSRLSLRANLQVFATLSDGTEIDATREVVFGNPEGGVLSGDLLTVQSAPGTGSVGVSLTRSGVTARTTFSFQIGPGLPAPTALRLTPPLLFAVEDSVVDLRALIRADADFTDGTTRDVTREVVYSDPVGGTLSGALFRPDGTVPTASVRVSFAQGGSARSAAVTVEVRRRIPSVTDLTLDPARIAIEPGSRLGLNANVQAVGTFDDGTKVDVSGWVQWGDPLGGTVSDSPSGAIFEPSIDSGLALVTASFSQGGTTRRALLAIEVTDGLPQPLGLFLEPASVEVVTGSRFGLLAGIQASLRNLDGSLEDVTRDVSWVLPVGGTLQDSPAGPVFVASRQEGNGSATAILLRENRQLFATLQIAVRAPQTTIAKLPFEAGSPAYADSRLVASRIAVLPEGTTGSPYSFPVAELLAGGAQSWTLAGGPSSLAAFGLELDPEGTLAGIPTTSAALSFAAAAQTPRGPEQLRLFLVVNPRIHLGPADRADGIPWQAPADCRDARAGTEVRSVSCGDLDGDGVADRLELTGPSGQERLRCRLVRVDGSASAIQLLCDAPGAVAVEAPDFDGDGLADALLLYPDRVELRLNETRRRRH